MSVVKIVILNWNGAEHLRRFLPSVVAAAPAGVGVVVADNGSTDGSLAVLAEKFPTVAVVRLDRNYGFAGGYNRALAGRGGLLPAAQFRCRDTPGMAGADPRRSGA